MDPTLPESNPIQFADSETRFGRRKKDPHLNLNTDESTSKNNESSSILSKFRSDNKPLSGPGSRGGAKKTVQPTFAKTGDGHLKLDVHRQSGHIQLPIPAPPGYPVYGPMGPVPMGMMPMGPGPMGVVPMGAIQMGAGAMGVPLVPGSLVPPGAQHMAQIMPTPHHHVVAPQHRRPAVKKKPHTGPVVALNYNTKSDIALLMDLKGYPVQESVWAGDIIRIMSFVNKFQALFDGIVLCPQDFELGLELDTEYETVFLPRVLEKPELEEEDNDVQEIDYKKIKQCQEKMDKLFVSLLSLVLNRNVDSHHLVGAINELQKVGWSYGYPVEWRNDDGLFDPPQAQLPLDSEPIPPVDTSLADVFQDNIFKYKSPVPMEQDPLKKLGKKGIVSLDPADRLVLLRIMTQWALTYSDAVRAVINDLTQHMDGTLEKVTYFAPRFLKNGVSDMGRAVKAAKAEAREHIRHEASIAKNDAERQEILKTLKTPPLAPDVNPLASPLGQGTLLRLQDFFVCDVQRFGRFYLPRLYSDDAEIGGMVGFDEFFHNLQKLSEKPLEEFKDIMSKITSFKLYCLDIETMLDAAYNDNGNNKENKEIWYEVAHDATSLRAFIDHFKKDHDLTNVNELKDPLLWVMFIMDRYQAMFARFEEFLASDFARKRRGRPQVSVAAALRADPEYSESSESPVTGRRTRSGRSYREDSPEEETRADRASRRRNQKHVNDSDDEEVETSRKRVKRTIVDDDVEIID